MHQSQIKKSYLWMSVIFNLVLLGFFKYFNFFIDSWIDFLSILGYKHQSTWTLNIILPVGISFYTFHFFDHFHHRFILWMMTLTSRFIYIYII